MADISVATRTPAVNLWVTFRPDGALLLELLADWYTVLGVAERSVEDVGGIAQILTSWGNSSSPEVHPRQLSGPGLARSQFTELRLNYSRGFAIGFVGAEHRDRSAMDGSYSDERLFVEFFGSSVPADADRLEAFVARLAREMRLFFRRAQAKAQERLAGGTYLAVLSGYLDRLRDMRSDQSAYRRIEHTLAAVVKDERYLRLAEDERARELVAAIDDELSYIYGRCMDLERGGQVH